jgi:ectoine hydroxylase-related dioxygenase (phytanoyl-CoA dioxygenase family)
LWLPIFEIEQENCLAFHPNYWNKAVKNGSLDYNCYDWYPEGRRLTETKQNDTRKRPEPLESMDMSQQVRIICNVGGIILFSGAQMHSTVSNTSGRTRWSIDFRTVLIDDVISQNG